MAIFAEQSDELSSQLEVAFKKKNFLTWSYLLSQGE
ncbi:hypothetical protein COLO4_28175 [Corchorus olitorius]|uniref:Uncharacterized protein n=1 Tax=Corchorus olitorius TaxID=93759 RepID=A0A1R3HMG5_9ROSI|nr:hypothetical protein COLO4_28175 [Corchorus olitorius]